MAAFPTYIKRAGKRLLRHAGIEAHSYVPASSRDAQLKASMQHFAITHVLDIGANEGQFGLELLENGYDGTLISVEPLREAHAILARHAKRHARWTAHAPVAVGASEGEIVFHVAANSVSSSALEVLSASTDAAPESRQIEQRTVPVTTVDALSAGCRLPGSGSMLKVDTQGFEWAVLDGAARTLNHFQLVYLELSLTGLYEGQRLWLEIIERMARSGFGVWSIHPEFVSPATGQTLQVNGLFHRL